MEFKFGPPKRIGMMLPTGYVSAGLDGGVRAGCPRSADAKKSRPELDRNPLAAAHQAGVAVHDLVVTIITDLHVDVDITGGGFRSRGTGNSRGRGANLGLRAVGALQGEARAVNSFEISVNGRVWMVGVDSSRRRPESRQRDLRAVHVEGEGFVLVGRVLPGVLREELHPLATECSEIRRAGHRHHDSLVTLSLLAGKDVAAIIGRVICEGSLSSAVND